VFQLEEYNNPQNGAPAQSAGAGSSGATAGGVAIPESAKLALQQAINDAFLGASTNSLSGAPASDKPVTDITGMVKRKKRAVEDGSEGKGKDAESAVQAAGSAAAEPTAPIVEPHSKKAKVEDADEA
jgi:hypothetical protein